MGRPFFLRSNSLPDTPRVAVLHPNLDAEPQALQLRTQFFPSTDLIAGERVVPSAGAVVLSTELPCDVRKGFLIASSC